MNRVYLETTVVSYLTAKPSRDIVMAAHQEVTREWWAQHRKRVELHMSQLVLDEAGRGDEEAARLRLEALNGLPLLDITPEAVVLARQLTAIGLLPEKAGADALHIAVATIHRMDIVLTWNCRHLANAQMLVEVGRFVRRKKYEMPIICTPDELMGDTGERP